MSDRKCFIRFYTKFTGVSLLLTVYDGGVNAVIATRQLVDMEVEIATTPLLEKIENDKPYTEFAKHVTESSDTVDVGEFSKIVKNEHIDIGRNRLFEWLRRNKFLMSNNTPYQKYIESKYFEVVETTKETAYGTKVFTKVLIIKECNPDFSDNSEYSKTIRHWLNNGEAKLLKFYNGECWIVSVSNVTTEQPENTDILTTTFNWTEIADAKKIENYIKLGMVQNEF